MGIWTKLILYTAFALTGAKVFAQGACVYLIANGSSSGRTGVCVDGVANQPACNQYKGVQNTFFAGDTCKNLLKNNKSATDLDLKISMAIPLREVEERGVATVAVAFRGVDEFTTSDLAGLQLSYVGQGTVTLRKVGAKILVNADNVQTKFTGYNAGRVSPQKAALFREAAASAVILGSRMEGELQVTGNQARIIMQQERTIQAGGLLGFVKSQGTAVANTNQTKIEYIGTGVTYHKFLE